MSTTLEQSAGAQIQDKDARRQSHASRLFTADEYDRMVEAGIFSEDERLELIEGSILTMSPKSVRHAAANDLAGDALKARLKGRALVRIQNPVRLDDASEPEPDIAVVAPQEKKYFDHHPTPAEVFLIVEVADSSLRFDRLTKGSLYAKSGIVQYAVLNIRARELEDYRDPSPEGYRSKQTYAAGESFDLVAFPDVMVGVDELLPPE